jgi:hypothetical protein
MKKIFSIILSLFLFSTAYATAFTTDCGNIVSITATPVTGYHFTQWQDGNTDNPRQVEVKASANYTASFAPNEYTIIFINEDGTELQKSLLAYGTMPVYNGATPTKPASDQHSYTFAGWSPEIAIVTGNATYTATYTTSVNNYTLTLLGENGVVTGAGSYEYGSVATISATPFECYRFKQWSDGNMNATREITITNDIELEAIFEVITYTITVETTNQEHGTVTIEVVGTPSDTYEYVDLGLSVKWATCNIGATKPEEYGDYFAWGETESRSRYEWANYKWSKMSSTGASLTKYNISRDYGIVDNKITLDQSDDVASVNFGGNWRIPTDAEMTELLEQCIWTWTAYNGVNGYKVTSKSNGNSIFLPAAGRCGYNGLTQVENNGLYWSSALGTDNPMTAHYLYFDLDEVGKAIHSRCEGLPVRPVCLYESAKPEPSSGIGVFSVSATKQVAFSPGNLQYTQSTNSWSFASTQYEMLGVDNVTGGNTDFDSQDGNYKEGTALADKMDLFGWSTASTYFGVTTSENDDDYYGSFVDWGTNQIGNDAPNTWRTLTYNEWDYLLNTRSHASSLCGVAQVSGVNGLVLLPDNWTCPAGISFKSGFHNNNYNVEAYGQYQTFTAEQWAKLEAAGAIFLPVTGTRNASTVSGTNYSYYWSASENGSNSEGGCCCFSFYSMEANAICGYPRLYGMSVRLVKDL